MPGLSGALDIARWSLYSSQLSIEVTAHNLANANTEGYSRQSLELRANNPITMGPGQMGTGVKAQQVVRAYDQFLNEQVNIKRSDYYYWSTETEAMDEIEMIFNESDEYGLNYILGEFWNAWSDVANNPDGVPEREALLGKSANLISIIKDIDYNLRAYEASLNNNIRAGVTQVNSIVSQIADLNTQISSVEIKGVINANDLRDQRDALLEELSSYIDINYYEEDSSGQMMVFIMGGTPLVLGNEHYELSTARNTATGNTDILWTDNAGREVNVTSEFEGGKIGGWVDVRDTKIDSYLTSLNTMTKELMWQVNSLHSEGNGLHAVSSMTGTVAVGALTDDLGTAFTFSDRYASGGSFDVIVYDANGEVANTYTIDPATDTVQALRDEINAEATAGGGEITASLSGGTSGYFQITANGNYTFAVNPSGSGSDGSLAILGVNTFFSWDDDTNVHDLTETFDLNSTVKTDSGLISASYLDEDHQIAPGDNRVAALTHALQDKVVSMDGIDTTIDAYYSSFVSRVGVDVQNAQMNEKYNSTLMDQYIQRKESVTGVNLDEEMTVLMKFQQAYQAAAKLIASCDEMFQALLSI